MYLDLFLMISRFLILECITVEENWSSTTFMWTLSQFISNKSSFWINDFQHNLSVTKSFFDIWWKLGENEYEMIRRKVSYLVIDVSSFLINAPLWIQIQNIEQAHMSKWQLYCSSPIGFIFMKLNQRLWFSSSEKLIILFVYILDD